MSAYDLSGQAHRDHITPNNKINPINNTIYTTTYLVVSKVNH